MGVRFSLLFEGVPFLLGHGLAEDKDVNNPLVVENPCSDQSIDPDNCESSNLCSACAVTRAKSRTAQNNSHPFDNVIDENVFHVSSFSRCS